MIKRILLTAFVAAFALSALAALPPQYANAPSQKDYPKADLLVLSDSQAYTLLPDGRVELKVRMVLKVLNYEGVDLVGDPKVPFNSATQELKILRSRTWTPAGAAVDTKANGFNEMTPFALEKAPAYTDIRQMVVTHVGIEVGAIIEREYTVTDKKPWRRFLDGMEPLRGESPTLLREVSLAVPAGTALKYAVQNGSGEPARSNADGKDLYTWTWKNLPALGEADTSQADRANAPYLIFTTAHDWSAQVGSLAPAVAKAVETVSPEMRTKLGELLKDASGDIEKVVRIQNYVATAFRTVEWPLSDFDCRPRSAVEIYDSGYGHSLDKGILLAAFLREAGYDATAGLGGFPPLPPVPALAPMNQALIRVDFAGTFTVFDPCMKLAERSHKDLGGIVALPLRAGFDQTHALSGIGAPDFMDLTLEAKAGEDLAIEGTATLTLEGWYSPYWTVRGCDEDLKAAAGSLLSGIFPGSEIVSVSVVRMEPGRCAFKAAFKAKAPKPLGPAKALIIGSTGASALNKIHGWHRSDRDLPAVLPCTVDERVSIKITLPAKLQPKALPRDVKIENGAGKAIQTVAVKDGVLTLTRAVSIPKPFVPATSWADLRNLANTLAADPARLVIF